MTKARTLADFISDGSPLADGTISVSEVSGAAPLASPTFTGTVTATSVSLNALLPTNAFATLVLNNAVGIANDPVAIDTWLETTASDGYKYGDMDKNGSIGANDGLQIIQIAGGVASEAVTSRWYDIVVPSLVQQSWYADLVADGTLVGGGAFSGPLTGNVTGELDLSAIAETIADTAVDVFVYDTSKDSDGGAWRKRTQGTSWYNETLNTSTRGSRKEFPAVAVIVAEATKVTIYDGDDPDLPMWMVFNQGTGSYIYSNGDALTSVSASNGMLVVGTFRLQVINFVSDNGWKSEDNWYYYSIKPIASRNDTNTTAYNNTGPRIVNNNVNDVAMTVLPNAPIDAATGLPVPTIAVATRNTNNYSGSVIKDDGTVVDINSYAGNTSHDYEYVTFSNDGTIWWARDFVFNDGYAYVANTTVDGVLLAEYGSTFNGRSTSSAQLINASTANIPKINDLSMYGSAVGQTVGLNIFDYNEDQDRSSVAHITSSYNTGWMNGAIKLATLSDTDATNVTGSELVTNGTFDTDTSGWTASNATLSVVSSTLKVADNGSNSTGYQAITTVVGKTYTISLDIVEVSGNTARVYVSSTQPTSGYLGTQLINTSTLGSYGLTFVANSTTTYLQLCSEGTSFVTFDNVSVRLAEKDRSVNGNGLQVFGTVTKNPVATGADLVAYSGFSNSNYLQQPYNSDLDFGTGDFCVMGWFRLNSGLVSQALMYRKTTLDNTRNGYGLDIDGSSRLRFHTRSGSNTDLFSTGSVADGTWKQVVAYRQNGLMYMFLNGVLNTSSTDTVRNLDNSTANLTMGFDQVSGGFALTGGSLALWRISATAPSPEQIAKMYRDEAPLFQENAQATLYGSSDAVTALAYDDTTELLHVGTSAGRSVFQGLRRVDNTTDAVGAAISASNGLVAED